jgi:hypothetical protein
VDQLCIWKLFARGQSQVQVKRTNFKPLLPKIGQHVMVTGRYLIEMPEMPGGITELHPVYAIKILP